MIDQAAFDMAQFRRVLGHYPTGVCVVTSLGADGGATGMVVGSFTSVSLDPPLVAFFSDRASTSWPRIHAAGRFCVNVLAAGQQELCRKFSLSGGDKFAGVSHGISPNGSPVLDGVIAWIDCEIDDVHEAGDHYIAIGRVKHLEVGALDAPLLFHRGSYGAFQAAVAAV